MYKICHTEDSSQRQRALEAELLAAMQKLPYQKITLTALCRQLNVPRKTFYRYFPTKDDCLLALIDHSLMDCNAVAMTGWEGDPELKQIDLERFFAYWQEHAQLLDVIRDNRFQYLLLDRTTVIVNAMKETREAAPSFARDQVEYFIAHGLMSTVLRWHHHGFQSSPQEMAMVFAQLLHSPDVSIANLML